MALSHLPQLVQDFFFDLAYLLDARHRERAQDILLGVLLASDRRTATAWFRAAQIHLDWRQAYVTICSVGRYADDLATTLTTLLRPVLNPKRLLLAIDDTPTPRYGPHVEGAGIHYNPTPGPANHKRLYGHNWVILSAIGKHPDRGTIPLPIQAQLYIRKQDVERLPEERPREFRTKLEQAAGQLEWINPYVRSDFEERWVVADGGYAKRAFLKPARRSGWVVVSRLRKDAQLWSVPSGQRRLGSRGPLPTYGKERIHLDLLAAREDCWEEVECQQYGERVVKKVKTFEATYRPAGGRIRVVVVEEESGWVPLFCTDANASVAEILEAYADRGSVEQMHRDVKEIWGAGQQQVRNVESNVGCMNMNLWLFSLVEVWSWDRLDEDLVDRSQSPWDREVRRPSHADKRKALRLATLRAETEEALSGAATEEGIEEVLERLLHLAL